MSAYAFGAGVMWGRSLVNSPATPIKFGALQNVSVDFEFSTKELYSSYQFPIAIGRGTGKISGKAQFAQFNALTFNDLFFGLTAAATGSVRTVNNETHTVGESVSNQVTATNGANFSSDLGVVLASDGTPYSRVTSGPVGQQYTCNETTGVYVFNSSQNNVAVLVSYKYADSGNGKKITIANQLLGNAPQFGMTLTQTFNGKPFTLELNACMSSKLSLPTKLEDFMISDFEFQSFADSAGNIGTFSLAE